MTQLQRPSPSGSISYWELPDLARLFSCVCHFIQVECLEDVVPGYFMLREIIRQQPVQFVFAWRDLSMDRQYNDMMARNNRDEPLCIQGCRRILQKHFGHFRMRVEENWNEFKVMLALEPPSEHFVMTDMSQRHEFVQLWTFEATTPAHVGTPPQEEVREE